MKKKQLKHKIVAVALVMAFTFQSLPRINEHTYTTGFSNFHFSCLGIYPIMPHTSYECGTPFHIN